MTITTGFIIKLICLALPFTILTFILHDGSSSGGIGGGGYDLSGLVYGSLLFAVIIIWLLWMLISYSNAKDSNQSTQQLILTAIGVVALIAAWFITPRMF
ncbi:hypothetical protein ACXZ1K_07995 [Pedobacter sp. PWIIR3]